MLLPLAHNATQGEVVLYGGANDTVVRPHRATTSAERFSEATGTWASQPATPVARAHQNTVLLPDGSIVTVGGGVGDDAPQDKRTTTEAHKQVELWDPATRQWRLGPSQVEGRAYHSTALLLPDGRVLSAGDDVAGGTDRDSFEIYRPPYLYKGARPTISSAPSSMGYGGAVQVGTPNADISRAVLVAPGTPTHAIDPNQRVVNLPAVSRSDGSGYDVTTPADVNVAPPGHYMLFLLDTTGRPSVARWVRLEAGTQPPPPPPPPAQCGDGADNDADGKVDFPADPGCTASTDTSESPDPSTPPPPAGVVLRHSTSTTRSGATDLAGKMIAGSAYVFTAPDTGVKSVAFHLDEQPDATPYRTEAYAPFDFAGGASTGAAAWSTTSVVNGSHVIRAVVTRTDGTKSTISSTFTVQNGTAPPPPPPPSGVVLKHSTASNRSNPTDLAGKTIAGAAWIFTAPDTGVKSVAFHLDEQPDATPYRTEAYAPFDFNGGSASWNTATVPNGSHTIRAVVTMTDATKTTISATFTVANP